MNALFDRTIQAAANWPEEDRKAFTEMAEASRDAFVTKGDWTFVNEFCAARRIPTGGCASHCTPETNFIMFMNPVWEHFRRLRVQKEDAEKREMYENMLKSGRKDEFVEHMQRHIRERDPDMGITQEVWQKFHAEEQHRELHERQVQNMKRNAEIMRLARIEEEAKRRIAAEEFEAAVQAKIQELKGLR